MQTTRWRLKRNCSLTPRQALAAWALPVTWLLGIAALAGLQGSWWIVGFALLNVLVLIVALKCYAAHALDGDVLWLSDDGMLHIEQQCGARVRTTVWRASLVRLEVTAGEPITLWAGCERLRVGAQVMPAARELAVCELRRALRLDASVPATAAIEVAQEA